jgi:nitrate/nitrite transporter NarK
LPLFAAAYAYAERTVYWRWAAPLLVAWAVAVAWQLGGGLALLPHAIAGLLAWLGVRLFPYHPHRAEAESEAPPQHLSLDL